MYLYTTTTATDIIYTDKQQQQSIPSQVAEGEPVGNWTCSS